MRKLLILALAASAWLSGCAALHRGHAGVSEESDNRPAAAAPSTPASAPSAATQPPEARPGESMPPVAVTELHSDAVMPLAAPTDLWDRIRRGFAMPNLDNDLVHQYEAWYVSHPDYIERMVGRSRLYLFHVVEELELRGMPTELALLPYIESAFNPQAISRAKAAGMWQFMPGTGRHFQLTQNILRDDRRNVIDSTRAALDYLQQLHNMFGDWDLALAAYNCGEGAVKRAIQRNQAAGLGAGYADLDLPAETRSYVPKLQAIKNIIANPQAFGAELPLIENHPFFDTVRITSDIDVAVAARLAEVRPEDFKALNPSQRKPVIFAAGTPQVLLPWDNAAIFKRNLAAAPPQSLASWTAWVAPATLPASEVAKRFDMKEKEFLAVNDIPRNVIIKAGSTVIVRRGHGTVANVDSHVVNNARLSYAPEVVLRRTLVRARRHDTIAAIAARYDLPPATVAGWNKTHPGAALKPGQPVALYLPVRAHAAKAKTKDKHHGRRAGPAKHKPARRAKRKSRR